MHILSISTISVSHRERATHYEGVLVRCSQVQSPRQLEVHEVLLVAVVGC
jgi:hypothetical protein